MLKTKLISGMEKCFLDECICKKYALDRDTMLKNERYTFQLAVQDDEPGAVGRIILFAEIDSPLKNYSSGMVARLGFAIATMSMPDILIVDEVLAVGDYKFRQKCEKRMKELLSGGTTLLYVSHSIEEVKRLCDHAIWIDKGVERMKGEAKEVCDAYMKEMKK